MHDDAEAAARARGVEFRRRLRAETIVLTPGMLARTLGVEASAIDDLRRDGEILALWDEGMWLYPAWQVRDGRLLPSLADVLRAVAELPMHNAWVALDLLTAPGAADDGSSVAHLLRAGRVGEALTFVQHYGEMGR